MMRECEERIVGKKIDMTPVREIILRPLGVSEEDRSI